MDNTISIDDQPIDANFFGEGKWLSDYITPTAPDIQILWRKITENAGSQQDRIVACWDWVAKQVKYVPFVKASINIQGKYSYSDDYWQTPSQVTKTKVGNCANKSFLLTSLLRNELSPGQVYTVLGNLHNGKEEGHAWVQVTLNGTEYLMESTRDDVPLLQTIYASRYVPVHYFNDQHILAVPGRTLMVPFSACYSEWLKDYLDWAYINNGGH